ncbi:MAG: flagellar biosynthesis protein FlhF [Gammaproteobacteria bacterium]|nr:MAG: flagellar biosynthesis protein FlhF [Gammaproteobacteria bacterium]
MKIKRYFSKNMREAIRKVREEQGPDAVILSNRKVDGGVEIVAAIDFDEVVLDAGAPVIPAPPRHATTGVRAAAAPAPAAMKPTAANAAPAPAAAAAPGAIPFPEPAILDMRRELKNLRGLMEQQISGLMWGDMARRKPLEANLLRLLLQLELSPGLCQQIVGELSDASANDAQKAWRNALGVLAHKLPVTDDEILARGGVVALVGPTGVGKTTTVAKLAARFAVRHGARKVALVTTDNYRIGAHEQLRAYARLLDVPLRTAADPNELREVLKELADRALVLIDTAGMSQRDVRLSEQFALIRGCHADIKSYLVLSATTREAGVDDIIRRYRNIQPRGCILTKMDEAGSLGGTLSQIIKHKLPVAYVSDGQKVPEDLYTASAPRLISRSVAMMRRAEQVPDDPSLAMILGGTAANA